LGQKTCFGVKNRGFGGQKQGFWGSKTGVLGSKTGVLGSKTGISKHSKFTEYLEFVLFQIFRKLRINDAKIKFLFSQKNSFCLEYSSSSLVCRAGPLLTYLEVFASLFVGFLLFQGPRVVKTVNYILKKHL